MYGLYDKKNLNIIILKILWEHTDAEHTLQQQEVQQLVKIEYGLEIDRRSVKNNVDALKDFFADTDIEISTEHGYCLHRREFDETELRLLIDSILFSKSLTQRQAKTLISKLKRQASKYFEAKVGHVYNLPEMRHSDNKQVLYTLDAIDEAISSNKKTSFVYNSYGTDFKLHPRRKERYTVSPYHILANNGKYYLVANFDSYDNLAHLRIDKMTSIEILEEKRKDKKKIPELTDGFSIPKHLAEHIYMFGGNSSSILVKCREGMMDELVDWFGKDFRIVEQKDDEITVRIHCNRNAMFYWALQYGTEVEVLDPVDLRGEIRDAIVGMAAKYESKI